MTRILGVAGSLRRGSFNLHLLQAARELMPTGATLDVRTIAGIPLYDADEERASGPPQAVTDLKQAIVVADGLVLATPEYNNGIPGVFKNAIDWLSRPASDIDRVFGDRPVAVIGASPGHSGTVLSQAGWLPVLRLLRTRMWFGGRLALARASDSFDDSGRLTDERVQAQLRAFMAGFVAFVEKG